MTTDRKHWGYDAFALGEEITSWVDNIALHEGQPEVEELVLDMVLSRTARERAGELVKRWLGERVAVGV